MKYMSLRLVLASICVAAVASGLALAAEMIRESSSVDLGEAESSRVELRVSRGELTLSGGADRLMEADFAYYPKSLKPDVSYKIIEGMGELKVHQPKLWGIMGAAKSEWNIRLGKDIPISLLVRSSSGKFDADLTGVNVTGLDVETSSGTAAARLDGPYPELSNLGLVASSGKASLDMSGQFPVLKAVDLSASSGGVNVRMAGQYDSALMVDLNSSSGPVELDMSGEFNAPAAVNVESSSGKVRVDLAGKWKKNANVRINASSGAVLLEVPTDVGVRVDAQSSSGVIDAKGFKPSGGAYVNDAYGKSDVIIDIKVRVSSGAIRLDLGY